MRIYLVGYMGAGKTSIGKELADRLCLDFIDIDIFIEKRFSKTINQIFDEYGEDRFREIENKVLKELSTFENIVVSTGGGTPCYFDNMSIMKQSGVTIYLSSSPQVLSKRLCSCRERRPLIKDKNDEELFTFIATNLSKRTEFYNLAHIEFDTDQIIKKEDINIYIKDLISLVNKHKTN